MIYNLCEKYFGNGIRCRCLNDYFIYPDFVSHPSNHSIRHSCRQLTALLGTTGVVDGVGHGLFNLLGQCLLQGLRDLAVARGVADLAGLFVAAGVVDRVGEFMLEFGWGLFLDLNVLTRDM